MDTKQCLPGPAASRAARCAAVIAALVLCAIFPLAAQTRQAAPKKQPAAPATAPAPQGRLVSSPLMQELVKIFPEISSGYLDLNGNGKSDETEDLNETIPESRVKDGQLQVQEVLDFIVASWRFIPQAKLEAVQKAVRNASGPIDQLIAIDFGASIDEAVRKRAEMGDELYLTPSAYNEAMAKLSDIISGMAQAYKKEGKQSETDFVTNRDNLFAMVEKGYPLPKDIPAEERSILSTSMIGTIVKESGSNKARTKTAIRIVGKLASPEAAPYLMDLAGTADYTTEAFKALGDIGHKPALPLLVKTLKESSDADVRKTALQAIGKIGGSEGLDSILELAKSPARDSLPPDILESVVQALAGIAKKGNTDVRIQATLKDFTGSDSPALRQAAVSGLGAFTTPVASEALLAALNGDRDPSVRAAAVASLNRQKNDAVVPAFIRVLREKDLDQSLRITVIAALGDNAQGVQAVSLMVDALGDQDQPVRAAAAGALKKLYAASPANGPLVIGALTRSLQTSQDDLFLGEGTALLAEFADPSSLPALLVLLQKPSGEVKRNVTWAFYRMRNSSNPKVTEELEKLVTSENESVAVRANAVRAIGAIGFDNAQLAVWQTLVTTTRMRGEKYAMLRFFAVRALGQLGNANDQVLAALVRVAAHESDLELRKEAVRALQLLAVASPDAGDALAAAFRQTDDLEFRLAVLEALADMGSDAVPGLAPDLLGDKVAPEVKHRVLYAVSRSGTEAAATTLIDALKDVKLQEFDSALLEGFPAPVMKPLVTRRLRTETNKDIIPVLESLDGVFSDR